MAESAGKRLRPLYATAFIHSFVLWYSIEKLFMRSVGLNDYLITIATLVYIVVMMTANIPLGLLADRWSRKGVLYIATCALIGSSVVCGFSHGLAAYATGISVWGLFYAAYAGTYDSAVYDVVLEETGSAEAFERCYGRVQMFEATAFITSALASRRRRPLRQPAGRVLPHDSVHLLCVPVLVPVPRAQPAPHGAKGAPGGSPGPDSARHDEGQRRLDRGRPGGQLRGDAPAHRVLPTVVPRAGAARALVRPDLRADVLRRLGRRRARATGCGAAARCWWPGSARW